jgi:hypothetical protein
MAVVLTASSPTSYTVPEGAQRMYAYAVGSGGIWEGGLGVGSGSGGVAYKLWFVSGGETVTYETNYVRYGSGGNARISFGGLSMIGGIGRSNNGSYPNNYGGVFGDYDQSISGEQGYGDYTGLMIGGAIGREYSASYPPDTLRLPAGAGASLLLTAVALAGRKTVEDDDPADPAFGSGGYYSGEYGGSSVTLRPGMGGGGVDYSYGPGSAAVVLHFT